MNIINHITYNVYCVFHLRYYHGHRPGCGFLNAGKGGTVYLGVKKSGIISGVEISRKDVSLASWFVKAFVAKLRMRP